MTVPLVLLFRVVLLCGGNYGKFDVLRLRLITIAPRCTPSILAYHNRLELVRAVRIAGAFFI